ncbi:MAG: hypothetical protein U5L08_07635 [Xanthomonadales bacterium]|nr:hypothetical protein [Xanthomonadales bacterium]
MTYTKDRNDDTQNRNYDEEISRLEEFNPHDHIVGGAFGRFIGAPVRFFAEFGVLGIPFILVYSLLLTIVGSAIVLGTIWGGVVALLYVLFGNM